MSVFFSIFLKSILNFEHFQKKDEPHRRCTSEITVSEKRELINVVKIALRRTIPSGTWELGPDTFAILTTAPLPYLVTTGNKIHFQKVDISAMQNLKTVC